MTIWPFGRRRATRRRSAHRRLACLIPAFALLVLAAHTAGAAARDPRNRIPVETGGGEVAATLDAPTFAAVSNGTLRLGINPEGHLDTIVGDGEWLGLEYVPTGAEGLINGCWCEGWGVADRATGVAGYASVANGGVSHAMTVTAFAVTGETADSTVEIGDRLRVRHVYHPSARPELYEVDLTVENIGSAPADVVYRRAMDWDVPPTEFDEFVTIQGSHPRLLDASDNGFNNVNPLLPLYDLGARGTFEDVGPDDRGGAFDFALGTLVPGESTTLTMFYGAASGEADALEALEAVDAELYSLGQSNTPDGPTLGTPTTFMFGVTDGAVATGPVIATGRLVVPGGGPVFDGDPAAISGSVALYLASTDDGGRTEDQLIAAATTEPDGTFVLRSPYTTALAAAAAVNDGQLNLDLVANVNGLEYVEPIIREFVDGTWVAEDGFAAREIVASPLTPGINPRLIPGSVGGATTGSTALAGGCIRYRFPLDSRRAWTTIGELHTPADTELATFTYGRKAESYISKAFSLDGTVWVLKGSVRVANESGSIGSATISYSTPEDRWAREIQTEFVYTKYRTELWCPSPAAVKVSEGYEIRATKWVGSSRLGADLRHLHGRCADDYAQYLAPHAPGFTFTRDENRYGTFTNAASVVVGGTSVSLHARSGMSQWVSVSWRFGPKRWSHMLCGTDAFPSEASRIFAGE